MAFFTNLMISRKLMAGFAVVIAAMTISSFIVFQKLSFIEDTSVWSTHTFYVLGSLQNAMAAMVDQETGVRGYLISGDEKFLEPYRKGGAAYAAAFRELKSLTADNPVQQSRLDGLNQFVEAWHGGIAEKEIALMAKPDTREAARALEASGAGKASMDGVRAKVAEIGDTERGLLSIRSAALHDAITVSFEATIIGSVVSLLVAAGMGFVLSRAIARPITGMTVAMSAIADGNYSVVIPSRNNADEIGKMAGAVEVFKQNGIEAARLTAEQQAERVTKEQRVERLDTLTRSFEAKAGELVGLVSAAATELQATSQSMAANAGRSSGQATQSAVAAQQANANVQTVAAAAEQLASSVSEISRQVAQSAKVASKAKGDAERTDAVVQALAEGAQKIGEVVSLISNIAGQTNLLALNATIEAARAGDAGKGFAVVASEVKSLATQTAKATDDISRQIAQIQTATKAAVESIRGIGATIGEMSEIAAAITTAVEEQGAATQEIARNVQQAAIGTQEVSANMAGVSEVATDTGEVASQVLAASGELSRQSEQLRAEVGRYIEGVKAA